MLSGWEEGCSDRCRCHGLVKYEKPKGRVQPNLALTVRHTAPQQAAPPSEPTDGRRGRPALVLSPRPARPEAEPRVSGVGELGEREVGPWVAAVAVVCTPGAEN